MCVLSIKVLIRKESGNLFHDPRSSFSYYLCLLVVLFVLVANALISVSLLFLIYSSSPCADTSTLSAMLANPLLPSFLDTYSRSMSFLVYKALCLVISFLVFWSICLSSFFVHFNNDPDYLTRGIAQMFTPFRGFLQQSLTSRNFLVLQWYFFLFFFHLRFFL